MRDALGLLDQAFAMVTDSKKILTDDVLLLTGRISTQEFSEITKQIRAGQTDQVLTQTNQLLQQGKEPQRILEDLIFYYRDLLLYKTAPGLEEIKAKIIADKEFTAAADSYTDEQLYLMIETLNKYLSELRFTAQNRIVLELALIRASRMFVKQGQPATTVEPVAKVEPTATEQKAPVTAAKPEAVPEAKPEVAAKTAPRVANGNGTIPNNMELSTYEKLCDLANAADDDEIWRIKEEWNAVLATLRQRKINVHAWFIDGEPVCVADKRIVVAFKSLMHRDTSNKLENLQLIEEVVEQNLASPYKVVNVMLRDWQQIVEPPQVEKKPQEKSADELVADTISLFVEEML